MVAKGVNVVLLATKPVPAVIVVAGVVTILLGPNGMKSQDSEDQFFNHDPVLVKIRSWSCRYPSKRKLFNFYFYYNLKSY